MAFFSQNELILDIVVIQRLKPSVQLMEKVYKTLTKMFHSTSYRLCLKSLSNNVALIRINFNGFVAALKRKIRDDKLAHYQPDGHNSTEHSY